MPENQLRSVSTKGIQRYPKVTGTKHPGVLLKVTRQQREGGGRVVTSGYAETV